MSDIIRMVLNSVSVLIATFLFGKYGIKAGLTAAAWVVCMVANTYLAFNG